MNERKVRVRRRLLLLLMLAVALTVGGLALADAPVGAPDENPHISWWTVDGGGGAASGGAYVVRGTAGQADAGVMSGTGYVVRGGFWGVDVVEGLYLPYFAR